MADDFWRVVREKMGQLDFQLILMDDQQIACVAVAAGLVQGDRVLGVNVNDKRYLAQQRLGATARACREPDILVWIQKEAVTGWLLAKLTHGDVPTR
jgi:hypothetical protein